MKYEYLLFNTIVLLAPFIMSIFYPVKWPRRIPTAIAISASALLFISFELTIVNIFWRFNEAFITGLYLHTLPLEELLFFVTVPFSCLVIWCNLKSFTTYSNTYSTVLKLIGIVLTYPLYLSIKNGLLYTASMLIGCIGIITVMLVLKSRVYYQKKYVFFLGIVNMLTLIFNYYLTARPVIIYNSIFKTNLQIKTIPLEDFIFGSILMSLVVCIYEYICNNHRT